MVRSAGLSRRRGVRQWNKDVRGKAKHRNVEERMGVSLRVPHQKTWQKRLFQIECTSSSVWIPLPARDSAFLCARPIPAFDMRSTILSDSDIRSVLRVRLSQKYRRKSRTAIIEELGLCRGQVRVDLSVVNGSLHGYEIKSDRDSLRRLKTQAVLYGKVFDRATLVVGERHFPEALNSLPEWWGIMLAQQSAKGLHLRTIRCARRNPSKDPRALVELLWHDESLQLLERRNAARGFRGKARWIVWDRICELCSLDEIARAVRTKLKARVKTEVPW